MNHANNPLSPELCRTFVVLIRQDGSVTKAAKELEVHKASVSKQIRPLVHGTPPWLPRPWLMKSGKRFLLTEEGRAMLPAATDHAERWQRFTTFASVGNTPGLTAACGQESAGTIVLQAATAFRRQCPSAPFRIAVVRGQRRIEGVANGLYDVALVTQTPDAIREIARREIAIEPLADDVLVLACAAKSPWAAKFADAGKPIAFAEMKNWPMVLPEADSAIRKQWDDRVQRQKSTQIPRAAVEVGGWRVLLGYVLANFGVGLLPKSIVADAGAKLLSRPLPGALRPANHLYLVRLPQSSNAELIETFVRTLAINR